MWIQCEETQRHTVIDAAAQVVYCGTDYNRAAAAYQRQVEEQAGPVDAAELYAVVEGIISNA